MCTFTELMRNVISVSPLEGNAIYILFKKDTPEKEIDFFWKALHIKITGTKINTEMIITYEKKSEKSLLLQMDKNAQIGSRSEVIIYQVNGPEQRFPLSKIAN